MGQAVEIEGKGPVAELHRLLRPPGDEPEILGSAGPARALPLPRAPRVSQNHLILCHRVSPLSLSPWRALAERPRRGFL